jgi:putative thioredoxin
LTEQTTTIRAVAEAAFDAEVVEASRTRPVVVDFWAPWCGPCHQVAPILERVAARHADDVDVVKVNVDEAPTVARRYGIRGIPAIKGYKNGAVAAELTGVQPEQVLERLFAALTPTVADRLVAQAAEASGPEQERLLREAVAAEPGHAGATLALARLLIAGGDAAEARVLLGRFPGDAEARRLLAELSLAEAADVDLDAVRAAAATGDHAAWLQLGRALAATGNHAEALPALIEAVRDPEVRQEARATVLEVFALLGEGHELVRAWRPRLAAALF